MATEKAIQDAMWAGDLDRLNDIAPCRCCCEEHTFFDCPARAWHGCRGQYTIDANDWADFYERTGRMTWIEFFPRNLEDDG